MKRAVLVDRDGTVIEDRGHLADPGGVALVPGAASGLAALAAEGFRVVVVSNQSGVGRGLVSEDQLQSVHDRMVDLLAGEGVILDAAFYCRHGPAEGCRCRKPEPGLILAAAGQLDLDVAASVAVGDQPRDVEAGRRAGCATVALVRPAAPRPEWSDAGTTADRMAAGWDQVVDAVLSLSSRSAPATADTRAAGSRR